MHDSTIPAAEGESLLKVRCICTRTLFSELFFLQVQLRLDKTMEDIRRAKGTAQQTTD